MARPQRDQVEWQPLSLDQLLPADHRARLVWSYVKLLNLEPLYAEIEVDGNTRGRTAIAPEVLVALWLLATIEGISSARKLERCCERDIAYRWLCGGVSVNYHTLSDFRVKHGKFLERLLVDTVAALVHKGLIPLETIAQDGMRVRAGAGKSSFRRKPTLEELQKQAQAHLDQLQTESDSESERQAGEARRKSAQERAAREREERIKEALAQQETLSQQREARKKGDGEKTRVSTTDPDARTMKMANGGFDPAFNVQFATDKDTRVIVGVDVTNEGTDAGELPPMLEQIQHHYGKTPAHVLVDSAYATKDSVTAAEQRETKVVSSIPRAEQIRKHGNDPHAPQYRDSPEYVRFRQRMAQAENQALYKERPSIAEFPNAVCRNQGLRQFNVRGLLKVKAIALWHALAFNFTRFLNLEFKLT
ncbi:MAG TPA: IS1182 family transposase [Terriglobales bacterium]